MTKLVTVAILAAPLCGCMGSGVSLFSTDQVDTTSTQSIKKAPEAVSDESTVRNAVSSADLGKLNGDPLPWANTGTGSAGVVTGINQVQDGGLVCREFLTTSHSFTGIAKYQGRTCLTGSGEWQLVSFQKLASQQ